MRSIYLPRELVYTMILASLSWGLVFGLDRPMSFMRFFWYAASAFTAILTIWIIVNIIFDLCTAKKSESKQLPLVGPDCCQFCWHPKTGHIGGRWECEHSDCNCVEYEEERRKA